MDPLTLGLGAVAAGGATLDGVVSYNRSLYVTEIQQYQRKVYQYQSNANAEGGMHREDVRDVFGLVITKLAAYITVCTLKLGFCISLFYDGCMPNSAPYWLF